MIMLLAGAAFAATQRHDTAVLLSAGQINGLTELLNNTTDYIVSKMAPDQVRLHFKSSYKTSIIARAIIPLLFTHTIAGESSLNSHRPW